MIDCNIYFQAVCAGRKSPVLPEEQPEEQKGCTLERKVLAEKKEDDGSAVHCQRNNGIVHRISFDGENYCLAQGYCHFQQENGMKAKKCAYKGR